MGWGHVIGINVDHDCAGPGRHDQANARRLVEYVVKAASVASADRGREHRQLGDGSENRSNKWTNSTSTLPSWTGLRWSACWAPCRRRRGRGIELCHLLQIGRLQRKRMVDSRPQPTNAGIDKKLRSDVVVEAIQGRDFFVVKSGDRLVEPCVVVGSRRRPQFVVYDVGPGEIHRLHGQHCPFNACNFGLGELQSAWEGDEQPEAQRNRAAPNSTDVRRRDLDETGAGDSTSSTETTSRSAPAAKSGPSSPSLLQTIVARSRSVSRRRGRTERGPQTRRVAGPSSSTASPGPTPPPETGQQTDKKSGRGQHWDKKSRVNRDTAGEQWSSRLQPQTLMPYGFLALTSPDPQTDEDARTRVRFPPPPPMTVTKVLVGALLERAPLAPGHAQDTQDAVAAECKG